MQVLFRKNFRLFPQVKSCNFNGCGSRLPYTYPRVSLFLYVVPIAVSCPIYCAESSFPGSPYVNYSRESCFPAFLGNYDAYYFPRIVIFGLSREF